MGCDYYTECGEFEIRFYDYDTGREIERVEIFSPKKMRISIDLIKGKER